MISSAFVSFILGSFFAPVLSITVVVSSTPIVKDFQSSCFIKYDNYVCIRTKKHNSFVKRLQINKNIDYSYYLQ